MIADIKLNEEDFLQQFPDSQQYMGDGLPYADWWEAGEDPLVQGAPVDISAMFGGQMQG